MIARDPFGGMEKDPFAMTTLLKQPKQRKKKRAKLDTPSTPAKKAKTIRRATSARKTMPRRKAKA